MLSPILFNLVLEKAIQTNVQSMEGANINGNKINTLAYADDVVIMSETGEGLEMLSLAFIEKCKLFGLECNVGKTKFMLMSRRDRIDGNINIEEMEIESVESFKYLGFTLTEDNLMDREIAERIGCVTDMLSPIDKVMKSRNISRRTKLRIYNIIIRPTVLYGCETLTLTKERMRKLEVFENGILRRITGPIYDAETNQWQRRHNADI